MLGRGGGVGVDFNLFGGDRVQQRSKQKAVKSVHRGVCIEWGFFFTEARNVCVGCALHGVVVGVELEAEDVVEDVNFGSIGI